MMRFFAWAVGVVTLLASGYLAASYLATWEWRRATFMAVVFVAVEVALATGLVLRRLVHLERRIGGEASPPDTAVRQRIEEAKPERHPFEWLDPTSGQTNVFITLLVGGGILISGLGWLLDWVASHTAQPALERRLAERMAALRYPDQLVIDDVPLIDEPDPSPHLLHPTVG